MSLAGYLVAYFENLSAYKLINTNGTSTVKVP